MAKQAPDVRWITGHPTAVASQRMNAVGFWQVIGLSDVWHMPDIRCPGRHRTSGKYRKSDSLLLDVVHRISVEYRKSVGLALLGSHRISGRCRTSGGSGRTGRPESTGTTVWLDRISGLAVLFCMRCTGFPAGAGRPVSSE